MKGVRELLLGDVCDELREVGGTGKTYGFNIKGKPLIFSCIRCAARMPDKNEHCRCKAAFYRAFEAASYSD